jgi:hypothetical protein
LNDENGLHYNLPAGGVEPNETIVVWENAMKGKIKNILLSLIFNVKDV